MNQNQKQSTLYKCKNNHYDKLHTLPRKGVRYYLAFCMKRNSNEQIDDLKESSMKAQTTLTNLLFCFKMRGLIDKQKIHIC